MGERELEEQLLELRQQAEEVEAAAAAAASPEASGGAAGADTETAAEELLQLLGDLRELIRLTEVWRCGQGALQGTSLKLPPLTGPTSPSARMFS